MINLLAAAVFFVLLHLLVSGTTVRDTLTSKIGQGPYMGLFSLASVAGLTWLGMAYGGARHEAWNLAYWDITPVTRHIQLGLMVLAMLLIVPGLTTPNPTSVRPAILAVRKPSRVRPTRRRGAMGTAWDMSRPSYTATAAGTWRKPSGAAAREKLDSEPKLCSCFVHS